MEANVYSIIRNCKALSNLLNFSSLISFNVLYLGLPFSLILFHILLPNYITVTLYNIFLLTLVTSITPNSLVCLCHCHYSILYCSPASLTLFHIYLLMFFIDSMPHIKILLNLLTLFTDIVPYFAVYFEKP